MFTLKFIVLKLCPVCDDKTYHLSFYLGILLLAPYSNNKTTGTRYGKVFITSAF